MHLSILPLALMASSSMASSLAFASHRNQTGSLLSKQCAAIKELGTLLAIANRTAPVPHIGFPGHKHNTTALIANLTAEYNTMKSNATLVTLCQQAGQVEKDCVRFEMHKPRNDTRHRNGTHHRDPHLRGPNYSVSLITQPTHNATATRTASRTVSARPMHTAIANNVTLASMCTAWEDNLRGGMSLTDAALAALAKVTASATAASTAVVQSTASTTTNTAASAASTSTKPSSADSLTADQPAILATVGLLVLGAFMSTM